MRKKILIGGLVMVMVLGVAGGYWQWRSYWLVPIGESGQIIAHDLEKYDFDALRASYKAVPAGRQVQRVESPKSKIEILKGIEEIEKRRNKKYDFQTNQIRFKSQGKWITGMMNWFPEKSSLSKVVIMIRGYADKPGYYSGFGSWRVADELAKAGYATISLDFLGYGGSDPESTNMMEARFEKVVNVLDLLAAVENLVWVDKSRIGIWAHSNGGQIALSVLEVTGESYPTVLWAPMTNPFPQSILDTASDLDDGGAAVRKAIVEFEKKYDARRYAFENYYGWINAPILILQGDNDPWCKVGWQQAVVDNLKAFGKQAELVVYPGAGHNLETKWEEGVERTVEFYESLR